MTSLGSIVRKFSNIGIDSSLFMGTNLLSALCITIVYLDTRSSDKVANQTNGVYNRAREKQIQMHEGGKRIKRD